MALDKQANKVKKESVPIVRATGSMLFNIINRLLALPCICGCMLLAGTLTANAAFAGAGPNALLGCGLALSQHPGTQAMTKAAAKKRSVKRRRVATLVQPEPTPNVTLKAVLVQGASPLSEGLSWNVYKVRDEDLKQLVWSGGAAEPKIHLRPGTYRVEVKYGLAEDSDDFEVEKKGTKVDATLALNAGTIRVKGVAVPGGPALDGMSFVLHKVAAGQPAAEMGQSALSEAVFHVPAGPYRLSMQHGLATNQMPVHVEAGKETQAEAVMNTGLLKLSARAAQDGPPFSAATFTIFEDREGASGREILRTERAEPELDLPAGRYRVAVTLGLVHDQRKVEVVAGKEISETFLLDAGGVRLSSTMAGKPQPLDHNLVYRVFSLLPDRGPIDQALTTMEDATPTMFLKSGKYRIESQYGWNNARQLRDVQVVAGGITDVRFEHQACDVTLKLVPKPGSAPMQRVKWTLSYSEGGTVLISQDATPALILQAGSYRATAQHDTKTFSRVFDAAANSEQTIEIVAE